MNLECEKVQAIKDFLDFIDYRKWKNKVKTVVAITEKGERIPLGTANFEDLAEAINYSKQ